MRVRIKVGKKSDVKVPTICAGCSSPIAPDATFCEVCHSPIVRKYCPKCSRLIPENSVSCPYCGAAAAKVKNQESTIAIPNITIIAIIGLVAGFFLMGDFFSGQKPEYKIQSSSNTQASNPATPSALVGSHAAVTSTLPISNQKPVVRSDEEGTKLNLQAYTLMQQGDYQKAEQILRQALQSFPQGTTAVGYKYTLYNLGRALRKTGRPKEALVYLEKCAQIDPERSMAQTELAVAKQQVQGSAVL
jgi:tetratricopeptide (TPR) repeat protein/RNA polymerase subunit RPABC4/transcription elongation factor Spt4